MANDLLASLQDLITPDLLGKAAALFGDSEPAVAKGMGAVFPVLLSSVAHRSSDGAFASTLYNLTRDPANDGNLLNNVASLLAPNAASSPMGTLGGKLLSSLFGNNQGNLASALSGFAGVKPSSGSSLLSFAAPLVLSLLGKAVRSGNLSLESLVALITGQKNSYAAAVPGPLARIESYLAAPATERQVASPPPPPPPPAPKSSIWRWLLPLLIALAVLWLLSRCMGGGQETTSMAPAPAPMESAPAPQAMPEVPTADLPLANFYFDVDKFELPVAREGSLDAVVAYLLANPTAVAAVSGYHDPTGDAAHNAELAKQRAQSVKDAMMAAGVPESQIDMVEPIETTGSGDMAEARRVEVSIRR